MASGSCWFDMQGYAHKQKVYIRIGNSGTQAYSPVFPVTHCLFWWGNLKQVVGTRRIHKVILTKENWENWATDLSTTHSWLLNYTGSHAHLIPDLYLYRFSLTIFCYVRFMAFICVYISSLFFFSLIYEIYLYVNFIVEIH